MMIIYRVWIYPCCNSILVVLEWPQPSSYCFSLMVYAGYLCVAIIHQNLTWTTGSLMCAKMLMHAIAHGGVRTLRESLHWKLTLGRKSLATPGNWTCISSVMVRYSNRPSYIPSHHEDNAIQLANFWHRCLWLGSGHTLKVQWQWKQWKVNKKDSSCLVWLVMVMQTWTATSQITPEVTQCVLKIQRNSHRHSLIFSTHTWALDLTHCNGWGY